MIDKSKKVNSSSERELMKAQEQFEAFDKNIKDMTMDRMNQAPIPETESSLKLSQQELANSKDIYLKPKRSISSKEKFNENFRENYNFDKEYVHFTAENKEIIGENIEMWTKPYPGMPAEFWEVPTNKPVWGPRYLAEQIKSKVHHRLTMQQQVITDTNFAGQMYGALAVDTTVKRLDAHPVEKRRSVFMGSTTF